MLAPVLRHLLNLFQVGVESCMSLCQRNVHCAAIFVGAITYVGYIAFMSIRWPPSDTPRRKRAADLDCEDSEDEEAHVAADHQSKNAVWRRLPPFAQMAIILASAAAVAFTLSSIAWRRQQNGICVAWRRGVGVDIEWEWNISKHDDAAAASMNAEASATANCTRPELDLTSVGITTNKSQVTTAPPAQHTPPPALTQEVAFARRADADFKWLCHSLIGELRALRKPKGAPSSVPMSRALRVLVKLRGFERHYRSHLQFLVEGATSAREAVAGAGKLAPVSRMAAVREQLKELKDMRSGARARVLEVVLEARLISSALPRQDATVQQAISCEPLLLGKLEAFAMHEAAQDTDATVLFTLGLYWSELGVAAIDTPFFGASSAGHSAAAAMGADWAEDAGFAGSSRKVPPAIAKAEALMLKGEEASKDEQERMERGAQRALRLYQHAKSLALMHHDGAAEARYLKAAEVAAQNQRHKLAGHALTRLSYFLFLRGNLRRALELSQQALAYGSDPLAEFLQVTTKRNLGELKTSEEVAAAEAQVFAVAGKLPSRTLEQQRTSMQRELEMWRHAATGGTLRACLALGDAARFLICFFGRAVFDSQLPPELMATSVTASPTQQSAVDDEL